MQPEPFIFAVRECLGLALQHAGMRLRVPLLVLAMLGFQAFGGCVKRERPMMISGQPSASTERPAIADRPIKSYRELVEGFDQTLTDAEKKAAIAELRKSGSRVTR